MYYIAKGDIVTVYREHCTHMGLGLKRIFIGREEKEKTKKGLSVRTTISCRSWLQVLSKALWPHL
jgi:hypothetical protein